MLGIVEQMHATISRGPFSRGPSRRARGPARLVYSAIRGVTALVGHALEYGLRPVQSLLERGDGSCPRPSAQRQALVAVLNGVVGDHLAATGNPLATAMTLTGLEGDPWRPAASSRTLLVFVHGLCMHPGQWKRASGELGTDLAAEFGSSLAYLHYNSGRAVAANGREFAELLEAVTQGGTAVRDIVIVGHSMGGLVARSACHAAEASGHAWRSKLRAMVFLGCPHQGAQLERGGHILESLLAGSRYTAAFARLGGLRSAGIQSLRHGRVLEEEQTAAARKATAVPLPADVRCYAVAGVLGEGKDALSGRLLGDGLVTVASALGRHRDARRRLQFEPEDVFIAQGHGHLDLLHSAAVRDRLIAWLGGRRVNRSPALRSRPTAPRPKTGR